MTTTAPIAGNQYFSQVFDQAGHLNLLNVSNLVIGTAITNSLEVAGSNPNLGTFYSGLTPAFGSQTLKDPSRIKLKLDNFGHILTSQAVPPVCVNTTHTAPPAFPGTPTIDFVAIVGDNSTDTAGQITLPPGLPIVTPPTVGSLTVFSFLFEFNRPFPTGNLSVQLTAANSEAAKLVSGGETTGAVPSGTNGVWVETTSTGFSINFEVQPGFAETAEATFNYIVTNTVALA
jgi:hypothetical protein